MSIDKYPAQEQVTVRPETATFEETGDGKHFGYVFCPFCFRMITVLGPKSDKGVAWLMQECRHSQGIAAGDCFDITVLFKGHHDTREA